MLIRQRIYSVLIGALLAGLVFGLGGCEQKTPTEKLRILCESVISCSVTSEGGRDDNEKEHGAEKLRIEEVGRCEIEDRQEGGA